MKEWDFKTPFTYMFKEPGWIGKTFAAIGLMLAGFLIFPLFTLSGYYINLIREIRDGRSQGLPKWDNLGLKTRDGFRYFISTALYTLPFILVFAAMMSLLLLFIVMIENGYGETAFIPYFGYIGLAMVTMPVGIIFRFWILAPYLVYIETGSMRSVLSVADIYNRIKANFGNYILVFFVMFGLSYIASIGAVLFYVGMIFTSLYVGFVSCHFYGQLLSKGFSAVKTNEES